jgi:putative hydrolase of the HAD superfamily
LVEGVHDILAVLHKQFRLAIITNGPSDLQRRKIEYFDLEERVDWVVVSGELGVDKPELAIFEHVLGLAGVGAERAAHVGDSLTSDVAGANRAGLLPIWVETRFPRNHGDREEFRPAATIQHVRELLDA